MSKGSDFFVDSISVDVRAIEHVTPKSVCLLFFKHFKDWLAQKRKLEHLQGVEILGDREKKRGADAHESWKQARSAFGCDRN